MTQSVKVNMLESQESHDRALPKQRQSSRRGWWADQSQTNRRSNAGRVENGSVFRFGMRGGFVMWQKRRRCDLRRKLSGQRSPLIRVARFRRDRGAGQGISAGAGESRARQSAYWCRSHGRGFDRRSHNLGWRSHQYQLIELDEVRVMVGPRRNKVVATRPGGARRSEALNHQKQNRPGSQPSQSFETNGHHHTFAAEPARTQAGQHYPRN